jgi:hypothetical protein
MHGVKYRFDIKTVSEANSRDHWGVKVRRKQRQQNDFALVWRKHRPKVEPPIAITFTRFSCKTLDDDNLRSCFKGIRDQLAKEIGIDDGSDQITWQYRQERTPTRTNYFTVTIEG